MDRFRAGDFDDPARIHGRDMPGLVDLEANAPRIDIVYTEVTAGATITFRIEDPKVVDALHRWFKAQTSDHGSHAKTG